MTDKPRRQMIKIGRRFASYLPEGYRLLGVDPGYLFVSLSGPSIDLPDNVVTCLLTKLERCYREYHPNT